ncbi:MAG TPA: lysoplasmalogenase [Clostridiales bacterium]|nr:lysoplasmalogenase [Clostridiales bacterium]
MLEGTLIGPVPEKLFLFPLVLGFIVLPFFLKAMWPKKTKKSLVLKMICSSFFLATGVLSAWGSQNKSAYAKLMLAGLFLGWLGDFLLHVKESEIYFLFGLISFLLGHVLFIAAFTFYAKQMGENSGISLGFQILIFAVILAGMLIFWKLEKFNLSLAGLPVFAYTAVIVTMNVKAVNLGFALFAERGDLTAGLTVMVGAVLFLISDSLLAVFNFSEREKSYPLKIINILTYYLAQNLLACSLFLIK